MLWGKSVVQSGMLEAGVDRILSEVVDPKVNPIFWPQTERAIREFLAAQRKAAVPGPTPEPGSQDPQLHPRRLPKDTPATFWELLWTNGEELDSLTSFNFRNEDKPRSSLTSGFNADRGGFRQKRDQAGL